RNADRSHSIEIQRSDADEIRALSQTVEADNPSTSPSCPVRESPPRVSTPVDVLGQRPD
ncbi:hypothetical protein Pmar_PMAR013053, partial [Perkinsus marinus ATCC 50983]